MSQEAVGWLLALYAGAVVGWVAEQLTIVRPGAALSAIMGMLAATVGNLAYSLIGPSGSTFDHLMVGVVSALSVMALMPRRKRHKSHASNGSASRAAAWKMYAMRK